MSRASKSVGVTLLFLTFSGALSTQTLEQAMRLKKEQRFAQAAQAFQAISSREPANIEALAQLATLQGWLQHYEEAIASWERAIAIDPNDIDHRIGLARVLYWNHNFVRAESELWLTLQTQP